MVIIENIRAIIDMIFHPVFICGVLGFLIFAIFERSKRLALLAGLILLFMLGWRFGILLSSTRYSMIFIIPFLIFTTYAISRVSDFLRIDIKIRRTIGGVIFIILLLVCCVKSFRHGSIDRDLISAMEKVRKDALADSKRAMVLEFGSKQYRRIAYYTGIRDTIQIDLPPETSISSELIESYLELYKISTPRIYLCIRYKAGENIQLDPAKFRLVTKCYENVKHSRILEFYAFDSPLKDALIKSSGQFPSGRDLMKNGSFEEFELWKDIGDKERFKEFAFFQNDLLKMPKYWDLNKSYGWYSFSSAGELELSEQALAGKYSLRIKSNDYGAIHCKESYEIGKYQFAILVKGESYSNWGVGFIFYDGTRYEVKKIQFQLPDDNLYECSFAVTPELSSIKEGSFSVLLFIESGHILFDNASLTPLH